MNEVPRNEVTEIEQEFAALVDQLLEECSCKLFAGYGHDLQRCDQTSDQPQPERVLLAIIGFIGECVRGSLAIAVDEKLVHASDPSMGKRAASGRRDWVGELSNQLLGRVKNKLLAYNLELAMNTPVVIEGAQLRMSGMSSNQVQMMFFAGEHCIHMWWNAEVDPALVLSQEGAPEVEAEGAMLLF